MDDIYAVLLVLELYKNLHVIRGYKMNRTYILVLFAEKPGDVYVALRKTINSCEQITEYLKDKYLAKRSGNTR